MFAVKLVDVLVRQNRDYESPDTGTTTISLLHNEDERPLISHQSPGDCCHADMSQAFEQDRQPWDVDRGPDRVYAQHHVYLSLPDPASSNAADHPAPNSSTESTRTALPRVISAARKAVWLLW